MNELQATDFEVPSEDTLPPEWPFQKRVNQVASKRYNAEIEAGGTGGRDWYGIEPRLPLSMIYHNIRRVGLWKEAGSARVAFVGRLVADGVPKKSANSLAWRLIEDALYWCEGESGFDPFVLAAEFDSMKSYGEERNYPAVPSEQEIAAALRVRDLLFSEADHALRLPTTVMQLYQRLGLWDLAKRVLDLRNPNGSRIGSHSTTAIWRFLHFYLQTHCTINELREAICLYLRQQT